MIPAERRKVARVLREAARIVAENELYLDPRQAIAHATNDVVLMRYLALDAFDSAYRFPPSMQFNESHRHIRTMMLLFAACAVETGDAINVTIDNAIDNARKEMT